MTNSESKKKALKHYTKVRFYEEETIKCFEIIFKLLSGQHKPVDPGNYLYETVKLNTSTINGLCSGLSYEVKNKKKVQRNNFSNIIASPREFINKLYLDNTGEFMLLFQFLRANLEEIITGLPSQLLALESDLKLKFPFIVNSKDGFEEPFRKLLIMNIFNYGKFSSKQGGGLPCDENGTNKWSRFQFAEMLSVRTCAYCNLNATFTVFTEKGDGVTAPSIDHFFDKSKRPLFGLSFYNLIPSCTVCNSTLKNTKNFTLKTYLHPYLSGFENGAKFTFHPHDAKSAYGFGENISVKLLVDPKQPLARQITNSIDCFKLDLMYSKYADVVQELILKKIAYNGRYLEIIKDNTYDGLNLTTEEVYRLAFGNYYDEKDHQKRPLAKMTRDIVDELGLI